MERVKQLGGSLIVVLLLAATVQTTGRDAKLAQAVKKGDTAAVPALLKQHVDVNAAEADGMTALHWAALQGNLDAANQLIRAGANAKATTRFGVTPIALAATSGDAAMIDVLLKAGADPNSATSEGETPLMVAARTGKVDAIKVLLAHGADVNARESWRGQTPLMWAAAENHADAVKTLIEGGADTKAHSKAGFSPLLFAAREGHLETVRVLIEAGEDPNDRVGRGGNSGAAVAGNGGVVRDRDMSSTGNTALSTAIINGNYEVAKYLLDKGADPNAPIPQGSPLHAVAWMRRPGDRPKVPIIGNVHSIELVKALVAHDANINKRIDWPEIRHTEGPTAAHRVETRSPANVGTGRSFLSFRGATPFYVAARNSDVELMKVLVDLGADPKISTEDNISPLMAAAGVGYWDGETAGPTNGTPESESLEAVKLALELGNDIHQVTTYIRYDKDGKRLKVQGDTVYLLTHAPLNYLEIPDGDMRRWAGTDALQGAAMRGASSIVQYLVDHGANLDHRNEAGWTAYTIARGAVVEVILKDWPDTARLIAKLMRERSLDLAKSPICDVCARLGAETDTRQFNSDKAFEAGTGVAVPKKGAASPEPKK
jgi:ankyrin repeat protein